MLLHPITSCLQEALYQQLLKAKEGEVEANRRRADDLYALAMAFAHGKGTRGYIA